MASHLHLIDARGLGRVIRRACPRSCPHVVFLPGMGGRNHSSVAYSIWQEFRVWFSDWTDFAAGGQEFCEYDDGPTSCVLHPGRKPVLNQQKINELKCLVINSADPVVLFGFSAGAYLAMKTAQELERDGTAGNLTALIVFGHSLWPADYWAETPCSVPGVIILGEHEMTEQAWIDGLGGGCVDLADIAGGGLLDKVGTCAAWGSYAGKPCECSRVASAFPNCVCIMAREAGHSLREYLHTLRGGSSGQAMLMERLCGAKVPSGRSSARSSTNSSLRSQSS